MPTQIPVCLVTGFLGAGKTTLLKQIISQHADKRLVYLVNEFSPRDIDGAIVATHTTDVVTIPGGSIFCKCLVTSFISQLRKLTEANTAPEGVVIEASGMANPKVIHTMLAETRLDTQYRIARIVTVVDPGSFHKLRQTLPGINDQIEMADIVIINKCDLFDTPTVDAPQRAIRETHPDAKILPASECAVSFELFPDAAEADTPNRPMGGEYALCRDPNYGTREISPVRELSPLDLEQLLYSVSDDLYRLKGFINWQNQPYKIDWTASEYSARPIETYHASTLVCIHRGTPSTALEKLCKHLQA